MLCVAVCSLRVVVACWQTCFIEVLVTDVLRRCFVVCLCGVACVVAPLSVVCNCCVCCLLFVVIRRSVLFAVRSCCSLSVVAVCSWSLVFLCRWRCLVWCVLFSLFVSRSRLLSVVWVANGCVLSYVFMLLLIVVVCCLLFVALGLLVVRFGRVLLFVLILIVD